MPITDIEAHPRSRGENERTSHTPVKTPGSSPLTRGKPLCSSGGLLFVRLIPAHAGKTRPGWVVMMVGPAHPRSRGENSRVSATGFVRCGSSPLTRGKLAPTDAGIPDRRLIPAHAGKTRRRRRTRRWMRAHPRSRGENIRRNRGVCEPIGSSPLTRGKLFLTCAFIAQIDQILESLELCASSGSYSLMDAYATDAPQDRVRSIGLAPLSSRGAS